MLRFSVRRHKPDMTMRTGFGWAVVSAMAFLSACGGDGHVVGDVASASAGAGGSSCASVGCGGNYWVAGSGGTAAGAGGSGGSMECPIGCSRPAVECDSGSQEPEVSWNCFGPQEEPNAPLESLQLLDENCRAFQTPRPTYCCPADFRSG